MNGSIFFYPISGGQIDCVTLISPPRLPDDPLPTLVNIVSAFQTLARDAQPGDFIYIHYSGHGTRLPTASRELKGENVPFDECLVLSRSDGKLDYLRDVEIAFLLKQIADKGATVTFLLDCCHSGGATRDDDLGGLPSDVGDDGGRGGSVMQHWMTASKGINFLAACRPEQKAQEVPREATMRKGLFTDCLASVINDQDGGADQLRSGEQDVVFGGRSDCHFFGVETVMQPAVVISTVETLFSAGKLKRTPNQSNAANLEQVKVGCIAVSLRGILKDQVLQPKGVWVSAADNSAEPPDPVVQKVRDCIRRESRLVELKGADGAFFKVLVQKDGTFTISYNSTDPEPSRRVTRTYPMPRESPIMTSPNTATRFFNKMSPSERVCNADQPDTFDRFVVLATSRDGLNFPTDVLPTLTRGRRGGHAGGGRALPVWGLSMRMAGGPASGWLSLGGLCSSWMCGWLQRSLLNIPSEKCNRN
ncbi:uncharacterized protein CTRU02_214782 [Colletotrichum truncatum]|uniref:Uncharacterized protein n=1 Tax=Colletotrichum truncatum TaxID=5467 RepID=A0ACC3YH23_COLTU|nr:uncharacterized protein CTRU02_09733 [Colletotrichum truncatum]KAF6788415.1 hypothetical protein CTRU02_09733 [Colletotrichum truncatum]